MHEDLVTVSDAAARQGFTVLGVTSGEPLREALAKLEAWCAAGHAGEMGYLTRDPPQRAEPRTLLAGVRSVISVAVNYWNPAPVFASEGRYGRVARYAWGRDYHDVVLPRLEALAAELVERLAGATRGRGACDHSPFLERAAAARAGLGFFGKNTCLLLPRRGSWWFLGEVLLDVELPSTTSAADEHCGTCRDCLVACPTDAFAEPYVLDARRCISYLTIEHRGPIPREHRRALGPWLFGCDVCQDVCPFNRFAQPTPWPELEPAAGVGGRLDLAEVLAIPDEAAFARRFGGTPLLRPGRRGLLRNAAVVARNVGADALVPVLERLAAGDVEPLVRGHALWALGGLDDAAARRARRRAATDPDSEVRREAVSADPGASA